MFQKIHEFVSAKNSYFITFLFYLYVIQGIPYGLQSRFFPLLLRQRGISLTQLGLNKFLYFPWVLKTTYAPIIELTLSRKRWLIITTSAISMLTLCLSHLFETNFNVSKNNVGDGGIASSMLIFNLILLAMNLCCAGQDIAVDGLAITHLQLDQMDTASLIQVVGYKLGGLVGGGVLVTLCSFVRGGTLLKCIALLYCIGVAWICFVYHRKQLPVCTQEKLPGNIEVTPEKKLEELQAGDNSKDIQNAVQKQSETVAADPSTSPSYWQTLKAALTTKGLARLLLFIVTYKIGEIGALNLLPLMLIDQKVYSLSQIGLFTGILGQFSTILGSACINRVLNLKKPWSAVRICCLGRLPCMFGILLITYSHHSLTKLFPQLQFYVLTVMMNALLIVSGALTTAIFSVMLKHSKSSLDCASSQSTQFTLLSTAEVFGKLMFAIITGVMADRFGYFYSYAFFCCVALTNCIYIQLLYKNELADECETMKLPEDKKRQ